MDWYRSTDQELRTPNRTHFTIPFTFFSIFQLTYFNTLLIVITTKMLTFNCFQSGKKANKQSVWCFYLLCISEHLI